MGAGLDSLGTGELRVALNDAFGADVPATFVFDHPTPAAMAGAICQLLNERTMAELQLEAAPAPESPSGTAAHVSRAEVAEAVADAVMGILGDMGPDQVITSPKLGTLSSLGRSCHEESPTECACPCQCTNPRLAMPGQNHSDHYLLHSSH